MYLFLIGATVALILYIYNQKQIIKGIKYKGNQSQLPKEAINSVKSKLIDKLKNNGAVTGNTNITTGSPT